MGKEDITIHLNPHQDTAIFAPERFVAIISGIQGGKTTAGAIWTRMRWDQYPNDDAIVGAPTYKVLHQSTLPKFFKLNPDLRRFYKKADQTIEDPSRKGIIYIRSLDDPNAIEGITARSVWLDEAGDMGYDAWVNAQGRVSILKGHVMLTTTWYNMGWLYSQFYEPWKKQTIGYEDYRVVQFRSIDNPHFSQDEYDRVRKTMDERTFRRRYEGLPEKMEGLVYDDFNIGFHVIEEEDVPKTFDYVIGGIDWGFSAPTAMIVIGIKDNVFYLVDEFYQPKKTTDELAEVALGWKEQYHVSRWYPDSAEPDRIETFKRKGLYCLDVNKDIPFGIQKVQGFFRTEQIKINRKCKHVIDEIERYHYPEGVDTKNSSELPVGKDDHAMDAMRYPIVSYQIPPKRDRKSIVLPRRVISPTTGY